jgi:hypothetical protein
MSVFFFNNKPPPWAVALSVQLSQIQKAIHDTMALVQVDQTALDNLATALEAVKTSLAAEIASLSAAIPAADLSGLNQALTDLQALEPPAPPAGS